MKTHFEVIVPDEQFWVQYRALWQNSLFPSPFQSPQLLQSHSGHARQDGEIIAYCGLSDQSLIGAAVFLKNKKTISFLSDLKTDANFFILHQQCSAELMEQFFRHFFHIAKKENWTLLLNYQPSWATYMEILDQAGRASGLYWRNISYSVCPVTANETPGALFSRLDGLRDFRYAANRLKKQEQAVFEAFTCDTDMALWADEFCRAHARRWAGTPTPSAYRDPARQRFLKNCLNAWLADRILVRFSVKAGQQRIGFAIGLLEQDTLIFHATTFEPDYKKYSPGKALLHFIAQWMAEHQIRLLDFGDGNEAYKYEVAEEERPLSRIFAARPLNLPFRLKTETIRLIRNNPKTYDFYREKLKRLFR